MVYYLVAWNSVNGSRVYYLGRKEASRRLTMLDDNSSWYGNLAGCQHECRFWSRSTRSVY